MSDSSNNGNLQIALEKLQDRVKYLESLLTLHNIQFDMEHKVIENPSISIENESEQQKIETNLTEKQLTKRALERYSRQMILPEIKYNGQCALQKSRVLVIGAGGIGAPASYYLAGMGVGHIGIIDHDKVEESNLHRQIIHSADRVGINKALSAKMTIERFNPLIDVKAYQFQLNQTNAEEIFQNYDIVLDASDNPKTRYLVSDAAVFAKIPLVSGSAVGWEGQLTVFNFQGGPCYRCLYPECPKGGSVRSCGDAGVIGMAPGIIGLLEAMECLKIIVGADKSKIMSQRMLIFDGFEGTFKSFKIRGAQKQCVSCGETKAIPKIQEYDYDEFVGSSCSTQTFNENPLFENISWSEFLLNLEENKKNGSSFIDVRPSSQFDVVNLRGFFNLPFEDLKVVEPSKLEELIGHKITKVFVMCRRGNFSRYAGNELKRRGYEQVFNVIGGIQEYGKQFDGTIPFI